MQMKEEELEKVRDELAVARTYFSRAEEYIYLANRRLSIVDDLLLDITHPVED